MFVSVYLSDTSHLPHCLLQIQSMQFNIARIKISKREVYKNKNIHRLGIEALRGFLKDALHQEDDVDKDTEFMKGLVVLRKGLNKRLKEQIAKGKTYDLNIPGKTICFLPSVDEDRDFSSSMANFTCCSSSGAVVNTEESKSVSAIYTDGESDYTNIILSDDLVNDHLCPSIEAILEKLAISFDLKPPFFYVNTGEESVAEV